MLFVVIIPVSSLADVPKFDEQLVYSLTHFNGKGYQESFVPRSEDTIYLLANMNSVINCRYTLVYYWPLTGKYVAAFKSLNEEVDGTFEILREDKTFKSLEKKQYCLFYPEGIMGDFSQMFVSEEAYAIFKKYEKPLSDFHEQLAEYSKEMLAYKQRLNQFIGQVRSRVEAGEKVDPEQIRAGMPKEPSPPDRPPFDITGIKEDFIVNLPEGAYQIHLRAKDGTIVEGSQKKLVTFSRRRVEGIGYEIIPGNRWTRREKCNAPSSTIYAAGDNVLYFRPFMEDEYNELYYNKMVDPQNHGNPERWIWAHTSPLKSVGLVFQGKGESLVKVDRLPYLVRQIPGPELGYEILTYSLSKYPDQSPAFEGHKLSFSANSGVGTYALWLENNENKRLQGSERRILLVRKKLGKLLYGASIFPLIIGIAIFIYRKRSTS